MTKTCLLFALSIGLVSCNQEQEPAAPEQQNQSNSGQQDQPRPYDWEPVLQGAEIIVLCDSVEVDETIRFKTERILRGDASIQITDADGYLHEFEVKQPNVTYGPQYVIGLKKYRNQVGEYQEFYSNVVRRIVENGAIQIAYSPATGEKWLRIDEIQ